MRTVTALAVLVASATLASAQAVDLLGYHVSNHDLVAEVGEACAGHETDPARPEDREWLFGLPAHARQLRGRSPRAIAIIVSFESESISVFTTQ